LYSLSIDPKALEKEIIFGEVALITTKGKAKEGLYQLLDYFDRKQI
jgi:hypothetical protein